MNDDEETLADAWWGGCTRARELEINIIHYNYPKKRSEKNILG